MNNKIIIFSTMAMLFVSFTFLAYSEKKQANMNDKNIWMTYFEDAKSSSLTFAIENHSDKKNFHWQLLQDKAIVNQGDAVIENGKTKTIMVPQADNTNKKMSVIVTAGEEKRELYKNL